MKDMNLIKNRNYWIEYQDSALPNSNFSGPGCFIELDENTSAIYGEPYGIFRIEDEIGEDDALFPIRCIDQKAGLNPYSLSKFTILVDEYNFLENNLRRIPKKKFIDTIKRVLQTDKEYAENVWHEFQAYPIPWLMNRRPQNQTEELLKLID